MLSQRKKVEDLIYKQFFSYLNTSLHEYQNLYLKGKMKMYKFFGEETNIFRISGDSIKTAHAAYYRIKIPKRNIFNVL